MKKCTYCGKEYPDDTTVCPQDGNPVVSSPSATPGVITAAPSSPSSGMAITSMILGIISVFLCGFFTGIPAVICGHIARGRARREPQQYGGAGMALAGVITGYVGIALTTIWIVAILAGLLLPALAKAKQKAVQINCASNLKQLGLAARIWSGDHDGVLPKSFLEMTNEISNPRILVCPADTAHTLPPNGTPMVWNANNITYEFVTPGMKEEDVKGQVIIRCPIHGTEVFGDGSVQLKTKKRASSD